MKSWPSMASRQLQSLKKVQQKFRDIACKANFFPPYLRQAIKIYVATSHSVVRQETIEISLQKTVFVWIFAQEVDWCLKDCDKQHLQTTVSVNLWKISAGHTGDWFDIETASICTTELWDTLKSFILNSFKIKMAPYPLIVSLDTLSHGSHTTISSFSHWSHHCRSWSLLLRKSTMKMILLRRADLPMTFDPNMTLFVPKFCPSLRRWWFSSTFSFSFLLPWWI